MNTNPVVTQFTADAKPFLAEIGKIKGQLTGFRSDVSKVTSQVANIAKGYLSFRAVTGTIRAVIDATAEAQAAQAQLNAALAAAGAPVKAASAEFQAYATQLQRTTTFGDEAIQQVETILLSFKGLSGGVIKDATASVLDLSTRMGIDASSAAKQLGRALEDPVAGLDTLSRSGVIFSDEQKAQIKVMQSVGDVAGAQGIVLKELADRFGGAAEAARDTFGGALASLKNAFGDLLEGGDGINAASSAINDLTALLSSPEIKEGFTTLIQGLALAAQWAAEATTAMVRATRGVGEFFGELVAGPGGMTAEQLQERIKTFESLRQQSLDAQPEMDSAALATSKVLIQGYDDQIAKLQHLLELRKEYGEIGGTSGVDSIKAPGVEFTTGGGSGQSDAARKAAQDAADELLVLHANMLAANAKLIADLEQQGIEAGDEIAEQNLERSLRFVDDNLRYMQEDAAARVQLERDTQDAITNLRAGAVNAGIGLLQSFAGKSKAAAKALILVNKAMAITRAVQDTHAAVMATIASNGGMPYAAPYVAVVKAIGAAQIAAIAATGIGELKSVDSGSSAPVAPGTPNNPIYTQTGDQQQQYGVSSKNVTQIIFRGPVYGLDDFQRAVAEAVQDVTSNDGIVITPGSRQAQDLQS